MPESFNLGPIEQIPDGGSKGFQVDGHALFAVRRGDLLRVYRNSCPHLGIELEWFPDRFLDAQNQFIQCSTHGALFLIESGDCISGPCSGDRLEQVHSDVVEGQLQVRL